MLSSIRRTRTSAPRWTYGSSQTLRFHNTPSLCCPPKGVEVEVQPSEVANPLFQMRRASKMQQDGPARTRFAPSPTGYLHLGSLRTALFNYMIAKASGGQFILRIEDTDQTRTVPDAEERLYRDLEWAGIEWDEGPKIGGPYGPYKQSERISIYQEYAEKLLNSGHAYRCFCTPEHLNNLAELQRAKGLSPTYNRHCLHAFTQDQALEKAHNGEKYVVRFIVPNNESLGYKDLVYGKMERRTNVGIRHDSSIEDPIVLKSDGFPTYHLANVVDDSMMKITHVIRGSEWMSSTHSHIGLYKALGLTPPKFAHVALLVDKNGQKLSKREGSMNISQLRDIGIFPETLTNFISLLGWSHRQSSDTMSLQDLVDNASFKFTRGNTTVAFEKLLFLQKRHAKRYATPQPPSSHNALSKPTHDLAKLATEPIVTALDDAVLEDPSKYGFYRRIPYGTERNVYVSKIVHLVATNLQYTTPIDLMTNFSYFFTAPTQEELHASLPALNRHSHIPSEVLAHCTLLAYTQILRYLLQIQREDWKRAELNEWLKTLISQNASSTEPIAGLRAETSNTMLEKAWSGIVHKCIRWAVFGGKNSPDTAGVLEILKREESIARIKMGIDVLAQAIKEEKEGS